MLEFFMDNKKMLYSSNEVLSVFGLDYKLNRGNTERILFSLYNMEILNRVTTNREKLGNISKKLPIDGKNKFYYGLNMKNPFCILLEQLFIIIKESPDYHPDKRRKENDQSL